MKRHALATVILSTTAFLITSPASAVEGNLPPPKCAAQSDGEAPASAYIIASSAAVRAAPSATAELLGYAPIATPLNLFCLQEGWAKVSLTGAMSINGWMRADLAGAELPTRDAALAALRSAQGGNPAALRTQSERVLAFAPLDESNFEAVLQEVRAAGDVEWTQKLERRLALLRAPTVTRAPNEVKLLLAIEGQSMNAVATFTDGMWQGYSASNGDDEEQRKADQKFANRYLSPGRAYNFYARGGVDGMVLSGGRQELSCSSMASDFKRVGGKPAVNRGLAANFPLTEQPAGQDAAATDGQKRAALDVAAAMLKAQGVPAAGIARLMRAPAGDEPGLVISTVPAPGQTAPILVLSSEYSNAESGQGHSFLLVMEMDRSGKYGATHRYFKKMKTYEDGGSYRLLAYVDTDGDGQQELVLAYRGYETWWYEMLQREGKGWKTLFKGGQGGC
ncbi:MAG TPA: hypothetical protein VGD52_19675 [Pseudoduganella sp.]